MNLSSTGLHDGVDFGLTPLDVPIVDDPNDPSRGSDRVDQFLRPTLCRLGEDEFRHLRTSQTFDLRRSGLMSGCVGKVSSILQDDQLRSMNRLCGRIRGSHIQLSLEISEDDRKSNLVCAMTEDTDGRFRWGDTRLGTNPPVQVSGVVSVDRVECDEAVSPLDGGSHHSTAAIILDNVFDFKG